MSVLGEDDRPIERDGKKGYSTICRRGEHKTCAMAKARCTCICHGLKGQTPPASEKPVSEATISTLPVSGRQDVTCDECGYVAVSANGLAVHRGRAHSTKKPPVAVKAKKTVVAKSPVPEPVEDRQLLAVVAQAYHDLSGADIASSINAAHSILDAIATVQVHR